MASAYNVFPVGVIHNREKDVRIEIYPSFTAAMKGLQQFSHIYVLYWLHLNDTPEKRQVLEVRPRKNPENPLTGVFATHSPRRPNPIALSRCRITEIFDNYIGIDQIDALDGSPVIDIKSFFPYDDDNAPIRLPDWK